MQGLVGMEREIKRLEGDIELLVKGRNPKIAYPYLTHQKEIFSSEKNIVLAKGRRWGATRGGVRRHLLKAVKGESNLWVDVGHRQMMRYVKGYIFPALKGMPKKFWKWSERQMQLSFSNGGYIDFGSAERPELMEGWGYQNIMLNEAGIILRDRDLYYNTLLPMALEGKGALWTIAGTPKGKGLFHELFLDAADPLNDEWEAYQRPSFENPFLSKKLLDRYIKTMPEVTYKQEILGEFISDGGEVFQGLGELFSLGKTKIPPQKNEVYIIGLDIAVKNDFTVFWVGKLSSREGVYCERFSNVTWQEVYRRAFAISQEYNDARLIVDQTSLGDPVVEALRNLGLVVEGIHFNNAIKNELINFLALDIEAGNLHLIEHPQTKGELGIFEKKIGRSGITQLGAPGGSHDDCVISLSLMNRGLGRPYKSTEIVFQDSAIAQELKRF